MEPSGIKVLIIDDDEDILELYSLYFEVYGFTIVGKAINGIEAIRLLKDSIPKPDFIIMDYHMPHLNGIDTSKIILEIDGSHKILMVSGDPAIKNEALSIGIIDFYEKPHDMKSLCNRIRELKDFDKN